MTKLAIGVRSGVVSGGTFATYTKKNQILVEGGGMQGKKGTQRGNESSASREPRRSWRGVPPRQQRKKLQTQTAALAKLIVKRGGEGRH